MSFNSYFNLFNENVKEYFSKNNDSQESYPLEGIKSLRVTLKKTKINLLFAKYVSDPRRLASTIYSLPSLLMHGLLNLMLHQPSRHAFSDAAKLSPCLQSNIAYLIGSPSNPSSKTVEDLFMSLDSTELEPILPRIFSSLLRSKFFILHPEFNAVEEGLLLSIDAQVNHTYHENNQHCVKSCPYCLKRTRGNTSWWLHCDVVLSVIGQNGFHFPLFFYRVKAKNALKKLSDEEFKQECELSALPHLLEKFRTFFPKIKATLGGDSLYAQRTTLDLCKRYNLYFIIVRKPGSLRSLTEDVEGLKKIEKPTLRKWKGKRFRFTQEAYFIENFTHKNHTFSIIDLHETATKKKTKRYAKVNKKTSHWQWITPTIKADEVWKEIDKGRLRWHQEDFYNTINNRGLNATHDFSRQPNSQTIWRFLTLIAFALLTLMTLSSLGVFSRKGCSIINWIRSIFSLLQWLPTNILMKTSLPRQMRFDSS